MAREFGGDGGVGYLDVCDAVDLADNKITVDGLHLNREARGIVAGRLVEPGSWWRGIGPALRRNQNRSK